MRPAETWENLEEFVNGLLDQPRIGKSLPKLK